jgi:hypothetical protein
LAFLFRSQEERFKSLRSHGSLPLPEKKKKIKENKMQTVGNWKLSDLTATREFGVCR